MRADPEGAAQDVRRFPTEPWMASRKIPSNPIQPVCFVGEGPFFWAPFLWASKEKCPGRDSGRNALLVPEMRKARHARPTSRKVYSEPCYFVFRADPACTYTGLPKTTKQSTLGPPKLLRVTMITEKGIVETESEGDTQDPDEIPIRDRRVITQPYDLVVSSLIDQIAAKTIYLRPLSERPAFQRRYVWTNILSSRLIESIALNVPIPPCYLSQNEDFELDVIDGQQRLFSIHRFLENQFALSGLEVLTELNGLRFHEIPAKMQRQIKTHTLRCVLITNESHPEIKFDVFERLNTNTVPLNAQELRNCIYRGALNDLIKDAAQYQPWLNILGKKSPDKRMRDEELILRFFAFQKLGLSSYRTPQKHWLNSAAKAGMRYSNLEIKRLESTWKHAIDQSLTLFEAGKAFRRPGSTAINRALFDLLASSTAHIDPAKLKKNRSEFLKRFKKLLADSEFQDLISRAVDHTKRTKRRFELWEKAFKGVL
ncbi:MAG: DUF262 domain-containing protein [Luteimonas sp.]|nr:DUF262 domain-containing protein [Luteimonas sp.]